MPSLCNFTTPIDSDECIGNSLSKINNNFDNLDANLCAALTLIESLSALVISSARGTSVPIGGIIIYAGPTTLFDANGRGLVGTDVENFGLCNGNQYGNVVSPNLVNKFVIGADPSVNDGSNIWKTTINDIELSSPTTPRQQGGNFEATHVSIRLEADERRDLRKKKVKNAAAPTRQYGIEDHGILPPYFAQAYIIKFK